VTIGTFESDIPDEGVVVVAMVEIIVMGRSEEEYC